LDEADEDGRDEDEFLDFVGDDTGQEGGERECREHDREAGEVDGVGDEADETGDVEEGHYGEDPVFREAVLVFGRWGVGRGEDLQLTKLVALGDYVVVGEHDGFREAGGAGGEVEVAAD